MDPVEAQLLAVGRDLRAAEPDPIDHEAMVRAITSGRAGASRFGPLLGGAVAVVVIVGAAWIGLGGAWRGQVGSTSNTVPLLTVSGPQHVCPLAAMFGYLAPNAQSGIGLSGNGANEPIRWPPGFTARLVGPTLTLVDAAGSQVAKVGDKVQVGGGLGADGIFAVCPASSIQIGTLPPWASLAP
jgi:hypothetical protein